jgi:hypothetical protein
LLRAAASALLCCSASCGYVTWKACCACKQQRQEKTQCSIGSGQVANMIRDGEGQATISAQATVM